MGIPISDHFVDVTNMIPIPSKSMVLKWWNYTELQSYGFFVQLNNENNCGANPILRSRIFT
ncbi:hypothetical protein SAMN05216420_101421 [Nitrosospira sp. Nl5]|nr:hypothetical protein SAMN05216420_101421 [Nitrosospira sp. Nl5]